MAANHQPDHAQRSDAPAPIAHPADQLVAIVDTAELLDATVAALAAEGVADADVVVSCGAEPAAALDASAARRGPARSAVRVVETLAVDDLEPEIKGRYEAALRDGGYVLRVRAADAERRERATEILRDHGAHSVAYHGRFTGAGLAPPARPG